MVADALAQAERDDSRAEILSEKPQAAGKEATDGAPQQPEKHEKDGEQKGHDEENKKDDGPAGGFDATPIPSVPAGFTIKITFHRATNLPIADINSLSSDPYVLAQMNASVPLRHKEDPELRFRTPTVRKNTDPVWDEEWIVANVPASGFKLKLRVYDEDPSDKDDRLGNVHITVPSLNEGWAGIREQPYEIRKRSGSKRAYFIRSVAVCFRKTHHMSGDLVVSIEMLGRTQPDGQNGRLYTVGPCRWIRHYSAMLGRLANIKEPNDHDQEQQEAANGEGEQKKGKVQSYNFQANQMQLQGPVPAQLYHRFVEFKPWVKLMFNTTGLRGAILGKALHHQHSRVYNFGRTTEWGHFPQGPSEEMTRKFLELVHYDQGGRIFTYVLTLDALWRFTETGKEFGVDLLSKHTMHSDVSIYIAFSGEFFIRRLKHAHRPPPPEPMEETSQSHPPSHEPNDSHPPDQLDGGPPDEDPPTDPSHYELVIDNDSGTYRPNAAKLPQLKDFMARALPGLHILTLDCQKDEERMGQMKDEQRRRKESEGNVMVVAQGSRSGSISSSDEEDLDRVEAGRPARPDPTEHGALTQAARDQRRKQQAKWSKAQRDYLGKGRDETDGEAVGGEGGASPST